MAINWSLLGPPADIGGAFQAGYETSRTRNALAAVTADPTNTNALADLGRYQPGLAMQLGRDNERRMAVQQEAQAAKQKRDTELIGNLAARSTTPEQWDANIDQVVAMGYPDAAQFKGRFEAREAVMAAAGVKPESANPDLVTIDGVAFDKRTGQPLFESPYDKIVSGPGGIYRQPRIGIGRGGTGPAPQGQAIPVTGDALPAGWEIVDDEGGAGQGDPRTFP